MRTLKHIAGLLLLLMLVLPSLASAHAELVRSIPEAGAVLAAAPSTVTAVFSGPVGPDGSAITVVDATGASVTDGPARLDPNDGGDQTLVVPLKPGLGAGTYTVRWTSISAEDGDKEEGTFTFTIREPSSGAGGSSPARAGAPGNPATSAGASSSSPAGTRVQTRANSEASPGASPGSSSKRSTGAPVAVMPATGAMNLPLLSIACAALLLCLAGLGLRRRVRRS